MTNEELYKFTDLDGLFETADNLPDVDRHDVYARNEEIEEWDRVPYRDSLWTDDGRATGIVSSNSDFYNIIQYSDILEQVGKAIEQKQDGQNIGVEGRVSLSPTAHKMSAKLDFKGETTVYASENDPIQLGLKIRSGHSGFHALKYDVGGERKVCSNGMIAFVSDLHFEQTHGEPFQPSLAYNSVDAVLESPEEVESRIQEAQSRELMNQDEALLVLMDYGIDRYLEDPVPDLLNALYDEVEDPESPTLWETYNSATRALTHYTEDIPQYELDQGLEQAANLLENEYSEVPDPDRLGQNAVERRAHDLIEEPGDEYWDGETETVSRLMIDHGIEI